MIIIDTNNIIKEVSFVVDEVSRLDGVIAKKLNISRSIAVKILASGLVLVNGDIPRQSYKTKKMDEIHISVPNIEEEMVNLTPLDIPFDVIYDCKHYAIINKPAGLQVHAGAGNYDHTLVNALLYKFNIEREEDDFRPGIVHRLDKDTSGIMIITKNALAKDKISKIFSNREILKKYLLVANGSPKQQFYSIEEPIARSTSNRTKMTVHPKGKPAKTDIKVLENFKDYFLGEAIIYTGRTHQIRVHMKHINHSIVGDSVYGRASKLIQRQALHSHSLSFIDCWTNKPVSYEAPLPEDMSKLLI